MFACNHDQCPSDEILGLWTLQSLLFTDCMDDDQNFDLSFGNESCVELINTLRCTEGTIDFKDGIFNRRINYLIDGVLDNTTVEIGTYSFSDTQDDLLNICIDDICSVGVVSFPDSGMTWRAKQLECNIVMIASK